MNGYLSETLSIILTFEILSVLNRYIDSISIYKIYFELAEIEKRVETGQSNGNELAKNPRSLMVIK